VEPSDVLSQTLLSIERPRRNRALVGTINFAFLPTRRFGVCSSGIAANLDTRNPCLHSCRFRFQVRSPLRLHERHRPVLSLWSHTHQPPGNAKILRQHTGASLSLASKVATMWLCASARELRLASVSRRGLFSCLSSAKSPLHHSVSTSAPIILQGHSMERCFTLVVRRPDRTTQTTAFHYCYPSEPFLTN